MTISPADAVVAARSFPRRWRELFARAEQGDALERSGAEDLAARAAAALVTTAGRLSGGPPASIAGGEPLERMDQGSAALVRAVESVPTDTWDHDSLDALTEGIDQAATLLRKAEAAVGEDDD